MCTSASLRWGIACISGAIHPQCTEKQMHAVMTQSCFIHKKSAATSIANILQTHEVVQAFPLPSKYRMREMFGCVGHEPPTECKPFCISFDDLSALLQTSRARTLIFTCNGHTTAFACGRHGCFHFDSAVAAVQETDFGAGNSKDKDIDTELLRSILASAHRGLQTDTDFTVTVIERHFNIDTITFWI